MIAKGSIVEGGRGVMQEAVQTEELLGPVPERFLRGSEGGGEDLIPDLVLPVVL